MSKGKRAQGRVEERQIKIRGKEYRFVPGPQTQAEKQAYQMLLKEVFGLRLQWWRPEEHIPHLLLEGEKAVANVSVNPMVFNQWGTPRRHVQLGGVMTHPAHRGCGLAAWLMEQVMQEWRGKCDGLFLFANDSVLDFYPRYGFEVTAEQQFFALLARCKDSAATRRLHMDVAKDRALLQEAHALSNPYSALAQQAGETLLWFYCDGPYREKIFYNEEFSLVYILDGNESAMVCVDIFGPKTGPGLGQALAALPLDGQKELALGFTPLNEEGGVFRPFQEEDTTLFVYGGGESPFARHRGMFPLMART